MQRAAASSPSTTASTPARDSNGRPSAKRQKTTDSEPSTPATPTFAAPHPTDLRAISAVLAAEEKTRSDARRRMIAAEGGETEWVLNMPVANGTTSSNVPVNGSGANEDESDEEYEEDDTVWRDHTIGRLSYGGFKRRKAQSSSTPAKDPDGEDDEELSEADSDLEDKDMKMELKGQALDKMNLKKQASGYMAKRGLYDNGEKKPIRKPQRPKR